MRLSLAVLIALVASPAAAQPAVAPVPTPVNLAAPAAGWGATVAYTAEAFRVDRPAWQTARVGVQRRFASGAVGLDLGRTDRNGDAALWGAADLYRTLWRGAYGNLRVQAAPEATTIARGDVLAEVYQALPGAFEASAGLRRVDYADSGLWLATASAARYAGPWLVRARSVGTRRAGTTALSLSGSARYLAEGRDGTVVPLLELAGGQGQEVVVAAPGAPGDLRRSWFALARVQARVQGPLGVSGTVAYTGDGALSRWTLEAGLWTRW